MPVYSVFPHFARNYICYRRNDARFPLRINIIKNSWKCHLICLHGKQERTSMNIHADTHGLAQHKLTLDTQQAWE